jgi:hypothetical protein
LVENEGEVDAQITEQAVPESVPVDWAPVYQSAVGSEREMVLALAEAGVVQPELGYESAGGIPISLAWPDRLIACEFGLETADRAELEAEGWTVLSLEELSAQLVGAGGRS